MYNRIAGYKLYYKSLVMLGVPIIIGQLGAIITGLADTIMVGQHSTEELAAACNKRIYHNGNRILL